ncbi:head-tail adaptor protein [Aquabacter spiritensis]|uniref:Head-tail adaptor n=1 Tax=Aquabacter spiritensis TaxID=933073 RepID=A0A4R3M7N0_9HYPH|nr:head-tail adaptor protein [Aquabacter spiritensis]TCT07627.1 head-tail adaptor [Aquabacter spiritensis]
MTAAALRHPLQHQTAVTLPDGMGGLERTWLTVDRLWGEMTPLSADPGPAQERPIATLGWRVSVRAPNTLAPGDRLVLGTRIFLVQAVTDPDGRGRISRCRCLEEQT